MAESADGFDMNFNMRVYRKDLEEFQKACEKNGEPNSSVVVRRMMADYADGSIEYNVTQEDK